MLINRTEYFSKSNLKVLFYLQLFVHQKTLLVYQINQNIYSNSVMEHFYIQKAWHEINNFLFYIIQTTSASYFIIRSSPVSVNIKVITQTSVTSHHSMQLGSWAKSLHSHSASEPSKRWTLIWSFYRPLDLTFMMLNSSTYGATEM